MRLGNSEPLDTGHSNQPGTLQCSPCEVFAALGSFFPRDVEHRTSTGSQKFLITEDQTSSHNIVLQNVIRVFNDPSTKKVS